MFRPTLRGALLLIAAWAVLFAPGAMAGAVGAVEHDPDSVAAAVVAPTFSTDAVAGRLDPSDDAGHGEHDTADQGVLPTTRSGPTERDADDRPAVGRARPPVATLVDDGERLRGPPAA